LGARLPALLCKNVTIAKFKEVKPGSNLTEFSKEGYGSKSAVSPTLMMMIFIPLEIFNRTKV
jgi:hypothetical protein